MPRIAALILLALLAPPAAHATFPGGNGKLVVSVDTCEFHPHLLAFDPAGAPLGPLTRPCEAGDTGEDDDIIASTSPEWSPDGTRLLFLRGPRGPVRPHTVAPDGSDLRPVGRPAVHLSYSPDGRRIAFIGPGLWTMRADGSDRRLLRRKPACYRDNFSCVSLEDPRWSPDGRYIAVRFDQFAFGSGRRARPRPGLWLLSARTGRAVRRIVPADRAGNAPFEPDWSPDGRRLVYRTAFQQDETAGGASGGDLWVVDRSGRNRRRIVHRRRMAEVSPAWSPDGRSIAWVGLGFSNGDVAFDVRPALMRVSAGGGRPELLARLPRPYVEEGDFHLPELSWQPLTGPSRRLPRCCTGGS